MNTRRGLLIVGHGTRQPRGQDEFWGLVRQVSQLLPDVPLQGAFLEWATPTIDDSLQRLAQRGVASVALMPLLLLAAGHAKQDIPAIAHAASDRLGLQLDLLPVLGDHPNLLSLSHQQCQHLLDQHQISTEQVLWILVGRVRKTRTPWPSSRPSSGNDASTRESSTPATDSWPPPSPAWTKSGPVRLPAPSGGSSCSRICCSTAVFSNGWKNAWPSKIRPHCGNVG